MSQQTKGNAEGGTDPLTGMFPGNGPALARFDGEGQLLAASSAFKQALVSSGRQVEGFSLPQRELRQLKAEGKAPPTERKLVEWPGSSGWAFFVISEPREQAGPLDLLLVPAAAYQGVLPLALLDALPIGLATFTQEDQVSTINTWLEELLAADLVELLGAPAEKFWQMVADNTAAPEIAAAWLQQARGAPEENPQVELELTGQRSRYLQVNFFSHQAGSGAIFIDNSEARDQVSWKLDLLSTLAHDLRTPLATLKGHATALTSNFSQWSQPMILEFLQAMDQGVDDLVRQVDRSLALTRLESGRLGLQLETVSVEDLIQGALERAASALGDRQVNVDLPEKAPQVRVDPARIEEVLANLLENAARFSPSDQAIAIDVSQAELTITLSVTDLGRGVPNEQRHKIFEKYSQFSGSSEGEGLGLFISQQIVEAHGGRIWVESPPPGASQGSAFRFSLPLIPTKRRQDQELQPPSASSDLSGQQAILVVEEDIDLQSLLKAILEPAGYQVKIAAGGPAALDALSSHSPAAIILDLKLSRMDGFSVCRSLRRRSAVPILVLAPQAGSQDLLAAIDSGADDFLVKPFQSTDLLARVKVLLRRAERWRRHRQGRSLTFGELEIDETNRRALLAGEPVHLTPIEYELLSYMAHHQGQVLTHNQLIETLWPLGKGNRHALFVHINRLRGKIEPDPEKPSYLVTRWGIGYTFLPKAHLS